MGDYILPGGFARLIPSTNTYPRPKGGLKRKVGGVLARKHIGGEGGGVGVQFSFSSRLWPQLLLEYRTGFFF